MLQPPEKLTRLCRFYCCLALAVVLLAGANLAATEGEWEQLIASARQARSAQKLPEAERLAKLALTAAEQLPADTRANAQGESLNLLGLVSLESGDPAIAAENFVAAAAAFEKAGPPAREMLAVTRLNLGVAYSQQKKFKEAADAYRQRLAILEELLGPESPEIISDLDRLSKACTADKQYAEALALLTRAKAILAKKHGPKSEQVATVIDRLADVWEQQSDYAESETLYRESLAIRREIHADSAHEDVFNSLYRLGDNRRLAGDLKAAQELFAQTDQKMVQRYSADAVERVNLLKLQLEIAKTTGDAPLQAECERVLARLEKIAAWQQTLPPINSGLNPEQLAAADPQLTASLAAAREFGDESLPVYLALLPRARWLQFKGQFADALTAFDETLKVGKVVYGDQHPEVAAIHFLRGNTLEQLGRIDDAKAAYLLAVESNEKSGFAVPSTELAIVLRLATISSNTKHLAEAIQWYSRYRRVRSELGRPPDPELGQHLNELGVCHAALEQWPEALTCFNEALSILEARLPADAPLLGTVRGNLEFVRGKLPAAVLPSESPLAPLPLPPLPPVSIATRPTASTTEPKTGEAAGKAADFGIKALIAVAIGLIISWQAWRRGYWPTTWLLAFLATCTTPIISACLLAALPDRKIHRRREKQRRLLAQQLQSAGVVPAVLAKPVVAAQAGSLGDEQTRL